MNKRILLTVLTLLVVGLASGIAIFAAKGYRFSPEEKTIFGTGILSLASEPDQASVYIDGHLTTATNANINSLEPKEYEIKIVKDGFIPWEKKVEVKQGLVTEIKATLFPAIPSIYPLTFKGAQKLALSDDKKRAAFIVLPTPDENTLPLQSRKSGVWVWDMSDRPVTFTRGREPHQILHEVPGVDFSQAELKWSSDSSQVLLSMKGQHLLLDANSTNNSPRDIAAILKPTLTNWEQERKTSTAARVAVIKDLKFRQIASSAAVLKWSADETKFLYKENKDANKFKVADLINKKTYDLPEAKSYEWLGNSRHLILEEYQGNNAVVVESKLDTTNSADKSKLPGGEDVLVSGSISLIEFDGGNKSVIYAGKFEPTSVFSWPDASRLVIVSSLPTPTASQPNLFGINLK